MVNKVTVRGITPPIPLIKDLKKDGVRRRNRNGSTQKVNTSIQQTVGLIEQVRVLIEQNSNFDNPEQIGDVVQIIVDEYFPNLCHSSSYRESLIQKITSAIVEYVATSEDLDLNQP